MDETNFLRRLDRWCIRCHALRRFERTADVWHCAFCGAAPVDWVNRQLNGLPPISQPLRPKRQTVSPKAVLTARTDGEGGQNSAGNRPRRDDRHAGRRSGRPDRDRGSYGL